MSAAILERIHSFVEALRPILYLPHFDFMEAEAWIEAVAGHRPVYCFSGTSGRKISLGVSETRSQTTLSAFLRAILIDSPAEAFVVVNDCHRYWDDPEALAWLEALIRRTQCEPETRLTVFLVSPRLVIPPELEAFITVVDVPLPDAGEIRAMLAEFCRAQGLDLAPDVEQRLSAALRGLQRYQVLQLLSLVYQSNGSLSLDDQSLIFKEKEQVIRKSGMIELVRTGETIDQIGGLDNLKAWLSRKARVFRQLDRALRAKVDPPRGILIVGMPGCGKSLTAKSIAALFDVPLLRLDMGKLLGKYVGESEENMRRTLKVAEAASPCVLWIDELEKAFAGAGKTGGASDVTTRLFGYFLTWMQEKESPVFVVATANDISNLPPEFFRRGRFDELFSVTFPTPEERRQIFEIHLRRREQSSQGMDTVEVLKKTPDFTGADIEAVVRQAVETAFLEERPQVTTEDLLAAISETRSLKVTMKERIEQLEAMLKQYHFQPASRSAPPDTPASGPHWSVKAGTVPLPREPHMTWPMAPVVEAEVAATASTATELMGAGEAVDKTWEGLDKANQVVDKAQKVVGTLPRPTGIQATVIVVGLTSGPQVMKPVADLLRPYPEAYERLLAPSFPIVIALNSRRDGEELASRLRQVGAEVHLRFGR